MKIVALILSLLLSVATAKQWWENGNFYQIYPRSFKDTNGDGVGDLKGITQKLQYIKELGMDAAWISPIFKSPMVDFGYDISDYRAIHYEYGTMEDFEELLKRAKELGLKILLDFVPNHTSDESEWFKKSVLREGNYTDYYIWHDGIKVDGQTRPDPPNNWVSQFRYSAWTWNEDRQQYYYHEFASRQPDLNYRNPIVVEEMKNVLRFWLAKGVNGVRMDAVWTLFEVEPDADGNYPDEPVDENCPDPDDYCHTHHTLTVDQPETYDMIYQWRAVFDEFQLDNGGEAPVILTEAYSSLENIMKYYESEDGTRNGSHVPFNFDLLVNTNKFSSAKDFSGYIDAYRKAIPAHHYANWVLGNHDQSRVASRFGKSRADLLSILLQTLPGIAVNYNGEEIVMTDVYIPWNETVDPQACNTDKDTFAEHSRDPQRTPFQWDASKNAGFSTGDKTWLRVAPDYRTNNVLLQQNAPSSHLHLFRKLKRLRDEPSMDKGTYESQLPNDDILLYKREFTGSDIYIILLNFGQTQLNVDIKSRFPGVGNRLEVITTSLQSGYQDGDIVQSNAAIAYAEVGTVFVSLK